MSAAYVGGASGILDTPSRAAPACADRQAPFDSFRGALAARVGRPEDVADATAWR